MYVPKKSSRSRKCSTAGNAFYSRKTVTARRCLQRNQRVEWPGAIARDQLAGFQDVTFCNRDSMFSDATLPEAGQRSRQRAARHLLPYLFVLYIIAFLDRMNVGAAALQMPGDLGFNDRVIGLGSGIFF